MKKKMKGLCLMAVLFLASCSDDGPQEGFADYVIATPITADLVQFKAEAVGVSEPVPMQESGKIYAYGDYIFVNDVGRGFHILDNTDPVTPVPIAFIKLEGNFDIAIKNNRLFADSYGDLVIFDISDINAIGDAQRIENAIYQQFWCTFDSTVKWPEADYYDYDGFDYGSQAIVGWEMETKRMRVTEFNDTYGYGQYEDIVLFNDAAAPTAPTTGQGGSFARFKIVADYLYAVEPFTINVFDISDIDNPIILEDVYTTGVIETIYNQGDILFLGGSNGLFIYDITDPAKPDYVSEFVHATACDPVVVDGDHAFVTLRGGNACGAAESGLYVIDVSDLNSPTQEAFYPLVSPYGLGFKEDKLFVCDGSNGLLVFDKSTVSDLQTLDHFKEVDAYDVIPLQESLLMIGNKELRQYRYSEDGLTHLSTVAL